MITVKDLRSVLFSYEDNMPVYIPNSSGFGLLKKIEHVREHDEKNEDIAFSDGFIRLLSE